MPSKRAPVHAERLTLPLKRLERGSLVHGTRLPRKIKLRIEQAGEGNQSIDFSRKELKSMLSEIADAAAFAMPADRKRLVSVENRILELMSEADDPATRKVSGGRASCDSTDSLFQFKITLLDIKPPIWRRVQVPDCTLGEFHEVIQVAMGWENYHLHQFIVQGKRYGMPDSDDFDFGLEMQDEDKIKLSQIVRKDGTRLRFVYEYDFGDGWRHEILFEGHPSLERGKYPRCVEGERACPPEDVGGPWGYPEFLKAIKNPRHEQHDELVDWAGDFDPEAFSVEVVNKMLQTLR